MRRPDNEAVKEAMLALDSEDNEIRTEVGRELVEVRVECIEAAEVVVSELVCDGSGLRDVGDDE